jgi:hypothetical protein
MGRSSVRAARRCPGWLRAPTVFLEPVEEILFVPSGAELDRARSGWQEGTLGPATCRDISELEFRSEAAEAADLLFEG